MKYQSIINEIHRDWCKDNGYPTNWYRARYGRPKIKKQKNIIKIKVFSSPYPYANSLL